MKFLLPLTFLLYFTINSNAQSSKNHLDSLKNVLQKTKSKSEKVVLYSKIAENEKNKDSIKFYLQKGFYLSKKMNDKNLLANSFFLKAELLFNNSKRFDSFSNNVHRGLKMATKPKVLTYGYELLSNKYIQDFKLIDSTLFYSTKILNLSKNKTSLFIANKKLCLYWRRKKNYEKSKKHGLKSLELTIESKNKDNISTSYTDLGNLYIDMRNYNLALTNYEQALKYAKNNSYNLVRIYTYLGYLVDVTEPKNEKSIEFYEKAAEISDHLDISKSLKAQPYISLSSIYLPFNKNKEALIAIEKIKELGYASKYPVFFKAYYNRYKASYFLNIGKKDSAIILFKKSIEFAKIKKNEYVIADAYMELGEIYHKNNIQLSKKYFLEAEKFGLKVNEPNIIPKVYIKLKEVYEADNNYKKAIEYSNIYTKINDSLDVIEKKSTVDKFLVKYETIEKENKILILAKDNQEKDLKIYNDRQMYLLIIFFSLLTLITLFTIILYKRKRNHLKTTLELAVEKEIIKRNNTILENISHEIRTPISIINGYHHLIKQKNTHPAEVSRYVDLAEKSTTNILTNFNDFLNLLRSNEEPVLLKKIEKKELSSFFKEILDAYKGTATKKNIGIYFKSNFKESLTLEYDFVGIEKIVTNLITNAIKYSNSKKNIYIAVLLEDTALKIEIKDEGYGIPKEEHKLVFNRFYQSKSHKVSGGFGIGLSLIKELVNNLNGTIDLESEENIGSIFTVTLPIEDINVALYLKPLKNKYKEITHIIEKEIKKETLNLPKILLVDDNLNMIGYLKEILQTQYTCISANNGREAMEIIKEQAIDLIISDYRMPTMDGLSFKEELNKTKELQDTPFLLLTAHSFNNFDKVKLRLGIQDYIAKPFTYQEIITRTRTLLENTLSIKNIKDIDTTLHLDSHIYSLLENIKELILKNLSNSEYTIKDLATDSNYGQRQLGKIVKENTGITLVKLILEIRLQKAYELIINKKHLTTLEVIYDVGLNNRSYFNKKFFDRFGIKPGDLYKKKYTS